MTLRRLAAKDGSAEMECDQAVPGPIKRTRPTGEQHLIWGPPAGGGSRLQNVEQEPCLLLSK